jgi:hypothetical protein
MSTSGTYFGGVGYGCVSFQISLVLDQSDTSISTTPQDYLHTEETQLKTTAREVWAGILRQRENHLWDGSDDR